MKHPLLSLIVMAVSSSSAFAFDSRNQQPVNRDQLQAQGQLQGQLSYNKNHNKVNAFGFSEGSESSSSLIVNEAAIPKKSKLTVRNNPSVVAPDLTTSNGTCHGSSSIGGSGAGAGLSFGTTWKDESCNLRYNATTMHEMGYKAVALRIMCQEPTVAKAAPDVCGNPATTTNKNGSDNGFF